ncbi:hypothetical protein BW723_04945 [Polaribacter reichenbachii]|uniref:Uncharacterized protein n=1 Tax=Polaribacter reichenbachii TaxID=996801 RepID=A0A1B8TUB9_9FLAO|nr:hypothetical protein [Polaribacter reichenbachii]APZ45683.1 hypothetical protein BW723_04945 [Polaribacter reichenbachii]AUC19545.1 hypothetical protein BTO17_12955 [Polaribacter reichenbachii]OBY63301.1 hypothetical protein LPB301_10765 [Polaribacter reichenbachii]
MFDFLQKKLSHSDCQKIFLEISSEVFDNLFLENGFIKIKTFTKLIESKIIYQKQDKFIEIRSINELDPRGESYFEINIGEKYNFEIDEFEGYFISINRYINIIKNKKKNSFYPFPYGKKQCSRILKKAKNDFVKYAEFYLKLNDNLFDRILRLKGIKK